ncbi:DNA-directed RNA polymerases I, partial [Conglomerata obtusa]
MIIPVRCFTCGKELSSKWERYVLECAENDDIAAVLENLEIRRICCRRMMLGHVDIIDKLLPYEGG